jgi:ABC-type lipoprotein export system ATPase subunit
MGSTLSLDNVTQQFNTGGQQISVLRAISASFCQGTSYAITGVSGSGKSTLLALLGGLAEPTAGTIYFDGRPLSTLIASNYTFFFHRLVSSVFQSAYLIPELSVIENVMLKGLRSGMSYRSCFERGGELLTQVGLSEKIHSYPAHLSGGERQRIALVRALFIQPAFLLADEPTAHLDDITKKHMLDLLCSYKQQHAMGLIISCHDPVVAQRMDRCYSLQQQTMVAVCSNL